MDLNNTTTPESERDLAQTPTWFVGAAENFFRFKYDLDVCANAVTAKCEIYYSLEELGIDALVTPWGRRNWCNPPYSNITPWVEKAMCEAQNGNISTLLIPDKPEVGYIRLCKSRADTLIHLPFRLNFLRPNGEPFLDKYGKPQGPKFPVCLVLFTPWGLGMPARDIYVDFRGYKNLID